ncbi:hypothetical protein RHMOL_Rhmol01G0025300 [Rhododendron molle]|uniref:Uncharacterized protein n=1 Tax=Rhododendron molle TaxID=49168 RepID=A0ACC0PYR1_RHOML|nr:hypothetical protein RHMOL_Rhmol01G0025300 [Rhododendron molle]
MDSRFRAIDGRPPTTYAPRPSTSNVSYFTEQARRVGYLGPNFGNTAERIRNPNPMHPMHEAVQRELEKEQIREEIIAAEKARRRALEEEVRREMMLEREMALRRGGGDGFTNFSGFEPRHSVMQHQFEGRSLEERIVSAIEERFSNGGRRAGIGGGFETVPFQRIAEPKVTEVKPTSEVCKEKVIFLAKPEGLSGTKRKAATPPTVCATEPPSVGPKRKRKEEWSCAICQVSATSERGLNEHLQGKKHKSKEAGLITQKAGKNYAIGLFPKKTSKPIKLVEPTNNKNLEQLQKSKPEDVKPNNDLALVVYASDSKNKNGDSEKMQDKGADWKKIQKNKNRFKFWCEMCQVGAFSEKVLHRHMKGKKHLGGLQRLEEKSRCGVAANLDEATKGSLKDGETMENESLEGYADGEVEENL